MGWSLIFFLFVIIVSASATKCGQTPVPPNLNPGNLVGGTVAIPYSWPWQIVLNKNNSLFCGGSIAASRWIFTAAHCVTDRNGSVIPPELYMVQTGVFNYTQR